MKNPDQSNSNNDQQVQGAQTQSEDVTISLENQEQDPSGSRSEQDYTTRPLPQTPSQKLGEAISTSEALFKDISDCLQELYGELRSSLQILSARGRNPFD